MKTWLLKVLSQHVILRWGLSRKKSPRRVCQSANHRHPHLLLAARPYRLWVCAVVPTGGAASTEFYIDCNMMPLAYLAVRSLDENVRVFDYNVKDPKCRNSNCPVFWPGEDPNLYAKSFITFMEVCSIYIRIQFANSLRSRFRASACIR
jgi:hypothetical protein